MRGFKRFGTMLAAGALATACALSVCAATVADKTVTKERALDGGMRLEVATATLNDRDQVMYTVTAPASDWTPAIGGAVYGRQLVDAVDPIGVDGDVGAALNGDHFSFKTGIPLGMSVSGGRLITSPIPAYNADDYYFHALGITSDGTVLTGENPTLYMQYETPDGTTVTIDRINRTREAWEGGQVVLYTPDYGPSTDTDYTGVEYVLRVDEGEVAANGGLKATVLSESWDNDSPLEEGTVVLSFHVTYYVNMEAPPQIGDQLSFYFAFEQEEWNDVQFAVGGNLTAVADGEVLPFDYTVGAFTAAAPRSAFGVRADGTYVLATVDGRSDVAGGMTANEMAAYMADDLGCEYAILLDGGGSTALALAGDGGMTIENVPSEERPVGNTLLLVHTPGEGVGAASGKTAKSGVDTVTLVVCIVSAVVIAAALVVLVVVLRKPKRGNGEND